MKDFFIYLALLSLSTYLIRAIPFVAFRKKITNPFVKSFLYYIPYAILAAMTLPTAIYATGHVPSAIAGLLAGSFFAFKGKSMTVVALISCAFAFVFNLIFNYIL